MADPQTPVWIKVLLLPVTFVLMIIALIYMLVCEIAEGVWIRMVLMWRREW